MYAAHDALPRDLRRRLEGRRGAFTYGGRRQGTALLNPEDRDRPPAFHPIIRTHPETGRRALYFDPGKILYIEGLPAEESDAVIEELSERMIQPDAQYRHRWRVGDIVIWDNRCFYHKAAGDYPPEEDRIHWRVSIKAAGGAPTLFPAERARLVAPGGVTALPARRATVRLTAVMAVDALPVITRPAWGGLVSQTRIRRHCCGRW